MDPQQVFDKKRPKKPEEINLPEGLSNRGGFWLLSVALQEKKKNSPVRKRKACVGSGKGGERQIQTQIGGRHKGDMVKRRLSQKSMRSHWPVQFPVYHDKSTPVQIHRLVDDRPVLHCSPS